MKNWAHLFWKVSCEVLIHARVPENDISDIWLIQADTFKYRPGQAILIMTSTRGVHPGPTNNPALLYHCRTQLQQRLTVSTKRKRVKEQIIERGIVRNSSPEDELPDAWQHKVQQHQRPQLPLPTERRSWWKLTARSAKLFIFLPFLSLFFFHSFSDNLQTHKKGLTTALW